MDDTLHHSEKIPSADLAEQPESDAADEVPPHLKARPSRLCQLQRFANQMASLYGAEVYLVGSALRPDNLEPRDWDVRICLSDYRFALRYDTHNWRAKMGTPQKVAEQWRCQRQTGLYTVFYWRWADEMVKYSDMGRNSTGLNVDFQVYPSSEWNRYDGFPRLRLDSREKDFQEYFRLLTMPHPPTR